MDEARLNEADQLHHEGKYAEERELLLSSVGTSAAVNWRICRAYHYLTLMSKDKAKTREYIDHALIVADAGIRLDENNVQCHTFKGIFIDLDSNYHGIKNRIKAAFEIREEFEKALKLDPCDYVANHSMGGWCLEATKLGRAERLIAKTFFATPPNSTYDEALNYFFKADEAFPNKYAENLIKIAECYNHKNDTENAKKYAQMVMNFTETDFDTNEAKTIAAGILK